MQKYMDKDRDYKYDTDAPRFGVRRRHNGTEKQWDIMCDASSGNCTTNPLLSDTNRNALFRNLITRISIEPPDDPHTPYLGKYLANLKNDRESGDYEVFSYMDRETAEASIEEAEEFLKEGRAYFRKDGCGLKLCNSLHNSMPLTFRAI